MDSNAKINWLRIYLRVLAAGLVTAFVPWITLIVLNAPLLAPGSALAPLLRFQPYNPYYESMLAAIYLAWAVMLWRAADDPLEHPLFLDFTGWGSAAHGAVMLVVTPMQKGVLMTFVEAVPLFVVAAGLWLLRHNNQRGLPQRRHAFS